MRFDRHLAQASFSFCHTVSNAVMPTGTACPKFHALLCFPPLQCLLSWTTCWLGCALTCYYASFTKHIYWSSSYLKPWIFSSQNLKNLKNYLKLLHLTLLKPHRLHHLLPLTPSLPKNLNLSGNIELLPESLLLQTNTEQTKDGKSFSLHYQLSKDVELSDLDFGLQQELRSSPQARADFLAPKLTSPEALHFDPDKANSS